MRFIAAFVGVLALLVVGGCAVLALLPTGDISPAKQAAWTLTERVLPADRTPADLIYLETYRDRSRVVGYGWRIGAGEGGRTGLRTPTHLGVLTCVRGERATEAVRFSHLHWQPAGCAGGKARLERGPRTPEQDERALEDRIGGPDAMGRSEALERASG